MKPRERRHDDPGGWPWRTGRKQSTSTRSLPDCRAASIEVAARWVAETPDHVALVEDGASWTYRELDRHVAEVAAVLASLGIRAGDRMIIVSENCIALAAPAFGGEPDRRLGNRRQSAAVAARARPDPRSQRRAADVLHTRPSPRKPRPMRRVATRRVGQSGRCRRSASRRLNERAIAEPVEQDAAKAGRGADLHVGHHRHAKGRDADP